jgi:hypothetical protein
VHPAAALTCFGASMPQLLLEAMFDLGLEEAREDGWEEAI